MYVRACVYVCVCSVKVSTQSSSPFTSSGLPASQLHTPVLCCFCTAWTAASSEAAFCRCRRSSSFCNVSIDWSFCLNSATSTCACNVVYLRVRIYCSEGLDSSDHCWRDLSTPFTLLISIHFTKGTPKSLKYSLPWKNHSPLLFCHIFPLYMGPKMNEMSST